MTGMEIFMGSSTSDASHATIADVNQPLCVHEGDAALIIRKDMTYLVVVPAKEANPETVTDAVYAAVGLGLIMEREEPVRKMVANVKRMALQT